MRSDPDPSLAGRSRHSVGTRRALALVIGLVALIVPAVAAPAQAATTWTQNLYDYRAFVYQDPYPTACTAASTMTMLNVIAYRRTGGEGFRWTPYKVKQNKVNKADPRDMTSILWWARAHDTLSVRGAGSDAHGWRNALNAFGWGVAAVSNPTLRVYDDLEFTSYDAAVHAAVRAIARYRMPVGILAWAGGHAQVMTGYVVDGANPAESDAFTVRYVYLSDPLYKNHRVNAKVSNASFKSGTWQIRFQAYRETDSPYDDPYKSGWRRSSVASWVGSSEWYRKWVIVAPTRAGTGVIIDPPPSPTPTPPPSPTPPASAAPTPTASPTATPSPSPTASPSAAPSTAPDGAAATVGAKESSPESSADLTPPPAASTAP